MRCAWIYGRLWQILAASLENDTCLSLQRMHVRRVCDVFRLKRGQDQAFGVENGSGSRISMRSAGIYGRLLQILAESDDIWPEMTRTLTWVGGM